MTEIQETIGLSHDLIIHPGETLAEVIEDRNISQRELAIRTGMTEKHISTVINGQKGISAAFAQKLEYALGIEASFWMRLQDDYERELLEYEDIHNISWQEKAVMSELRGIIDFWTGYGVIEHTSAANVIEIRRLLGISNLLDIPKMSCISAYRAQTKKASVNLYALYAWQVTCEQLTRDIPVTDGMNPEKLNKRVGDIKSAMFLNDNQILKALEEIFAECGIAFRVVPYFDGAPTQGYIKRRKDGTLILCVNAMQRFADAFWFALFNEISHILKGNIKNEYTDFAPELTANVNEPDTLLNELLIDKKAYKKFIKSGDYKTRQGITEFARSQNVRDYIVRGILMRKQLIPWETRPKYNWM